MRCEVLPGKGNQRLSKRGWHPVTPSAMGPVSWLLDTPVSLALSEGLMSCPKCVEKEAKAYLEEKAQGRYPFAVW